VKRSGPREIRALVACCGVQPYHAYARRRLIEMLGRVGGNASALASTLDCSTRMARWIVRAYEIERPARTPKPKPQRVPRERLDTPEGRAPHAARTDCACRWCAWQRGAA